MSDSRELYLKQLTQFFWENELTPDVTQIELLAEYAQLLVERNDIVNLVSRKDTPNVIENHVFISALLSNYVPSRCTRFIDIGTGGGLPGIPLAIMRPELRGVVVDSIKKKIDSVQHFAETLLLNSVTPELARVEDDSFISRYQSSFDLVVSRATVPLILLVRYALPLITNKAHLIALKGGDLTEEFDKMFTKYSSHIKKSTIYELHYKPSNIKNIKEKKLVVLEISK